MDWSNEFSEVSFGDKYLNRRFLKVMSAFSLRPGETIAKACGLWSEAKGGISTIFYAFRENSYG